MKSTWIRITDIFRLHMLHCMYEGVVEYLRLNYMNFAWSIATVLLVYAVYRLLAGFIKKKGQKLELEPHVRNILRLLLRVVAIVIATTTVFNIFELPTNIFLGSSALVGAALGFGSSQTINNIVAGFYVLLTQPFKVKDYVKIGDLEGQVEEISINYTSLYTPTFNLLRVPNTQVMNSKTLNLTHEGYIKYTFKVGFGHELTEEQVMDEIIKPAIEDFHDNCVNGEFRRPEAYMDVVDRLGKTYMIRLFIPKGEARTLYTMQPELTRLIMKKYDDVRAVK
ncbi:MAG TPA: mechanosensitive ion channel domain-containing protein [Candidatus Krumholzibacteriaceae bacterium]|nr:mechanosensitive ion channel domain-containing protein [Candidatus Krumholzibacteriaceae bacterium]